MSNDDGYGSQSSREDFNAVFLAAMDERDLNWQEVCRRAQVPESVAASAVREGTYGLNRNYEVLYRLSAVLGIDFVSLISCPISADAKQRASLSMRVKKLVWEYVVKANLTVADGEFIIAAIKERVRKVPTSSLQTAHRAAFGLPYNWKDVARIHQQLKRERND